MQNVGESAEIRKCKQRMGELRNAGDGRSVREFGDAQRNRRRRNQIDGLRNAAGVLIRDERGKADIMADYFQNLFSTEAGDDRSVLDCLTRQVSEDQNSMLVKEVSTEEVKTAIFGMHPDKSPGPDGLSSAFFQTHWDVVGEEVVNFCKLFLHTGRSIIDNVLLTFESNHDMNRVQGDRGGYGALKVDMSKAYDRVEWGFLGRVMTKLGFSERWVSLMHECISTVQYRVLVEGKEWGPIVPTRGLRQGDPLSPCLFILVAESLSAMLRVQEMEGGLQGVRVARGAPRISHLFFADDCLFFFRANNLEAGIIGEVLKEYGRASGQQVNFVKIAIVFGNNVGREDKEAVLESLGITEQQGGRSYLGLPGFVGRRKREILGFIREKVRNRILYWGNQFLSRARREVLLKTVLQAISNYAMNGWNFMHKPDALVTRVFKARYFPNCSFLDAKPGSNPSFVWSSIRETQNMLREGVRWGIGNGEHVRVWEDPWLPNDANPYVSTHNPGFESSTLGETNGLYFVRSAYRILTEMCVTGNGYEWTAVCDLNLPPKIKCFFWTLCSLRLPTKDALMVKQVRCNPLCTLCGLENETAVHVFANCAFAHLCWRILEPAWVLTEMDSIGQWVQEMFLSLSRQMVEKVIVVCWALWENRNNSV
ncbi:uncharacterized protein LOC116029604 [Ipomoea triloba]|uniref:uncharacterized protein LOC116029604 n=1 Tax=Ipomoea triloba TaxID=35885 RepID=UPI00125DC184|nr:uncharacterized protein LOC116029604 [Ipomoea triloba]